MLVAEVPLWEPRAYMEAGGAPLTILCWCAGRVGSEGWVMGPLGGPYYGFGAMRRSVGVVRALSKDALRQVQLRAGRNVT